MSRCLEAATPHFVDSAVATGEAVLVFSSVRSKAPMALSHTAFSPESGTAARCSSALIMSQCPKRYTLKPSIMSQCCDGPAAPICNLTGPWPLWQNRDLVPIPGIEDESLSEDYSTESSSHAKVSNKAKKRVRKWRLKFKVQKRLRTELSAPVRHELHKAPRRRRGFIVAAGLLNAEEIRLVHDLALHPSVQEICDRKASLEYRHVAYRMELPLRAHGHSLYTKLMTTMAWADAMLWQKLGLQKGNRGMPQARIKRT
eukprot:s2099_g6.t1